jgi:hypothetical protein
VIGYFLIAMILVVQLLTPKMIIPMSANLNERFIIGPFLEGKIFIPGKTAGLVGGAGCCADSGSGFNCRYLHIQRDQA